MSGQEVDLEGEVIEECWDIVFVMSIRMIYRSKNHTMQTLLEMTHPSVVELQYLLNTVLREIKSLDRKALDEFQKFETYKIEDFVKDIQGMLDAITAGNEVELKRLSRKLDGRL